MKVFTPEFIHILAAANKTERENRHPQFIEIKGLRDRMESLYKEVEEETQRRVQLGITNKLSAGVINGRK